MSKNVGIFFYPLIHFPDCFVGADVLSIYFARELSSVRRSDHGLLAVWQVPPLWKADPAIACAQRDLSPDPNASAIELDTVYCLAATCAA